MSQFKNPFPPKVRSFDVEDDGVKATFHYLRPRADQIMEDADRDDAARKEREASAKDGAAPPAPGRVEVNAKTIRQWIVHPDGSPFSDAEAAEVLRMDAVPFQQFSTKLTAAMSPNKAEGEQKNG